MNFRGIFLMNFSYEFSQPQINWNKEIYYNYEFSGGDIEINT